MLFRRGMLIDGEFVQGHFNFLGHFIPELYQRGAGNVLEMTPRRQMKRTSRRKKSFCKVYEFVPAEGRNGEQL